MDHELPEEWRIALVPNKSRLLEDTRRRIFTRFLPGLGIRPMEGVEWDQKEEPEQVSKLEAARRAIALWLLKTYLLEADEPTTLNRLQRKHRQRREAACPAEPADYEAPPPADLQKQLAENYLTQWHRFEHVDKLPVDLLYAVRRGESVSALVSYIDDGGGERDFQHRNRADVELYMVPAKEIAPEARELFLDPEIYTDTRPVVVMRIYSTWQDGKEYYFDALTGKRCPDPEPRNYAEIDSFPARQKQYNERLRQDRYKRVSRQVRAMVEELLRDSSSLEVAEEELARMSRALLEAYDLRYNVTSKHDRAIWEEAATRAVAEIGPTVSMEETIKRMKELRGGVIADYIDRGSAGPSMRDATSALETRFHPADYSLAWRQLPWRMATALLPGMEGGRLAEMMLYTNISERYDHNRTEQDMIQDPALERERIAYALQRIALSIRGSDEGGTMEVPSQLVDAAVQLFEKLSRDSGEYLEKFSPDQRPSRRFDIFADAFIRQCYVMMNNYLRQEPVDSIVGAVKRILDAPIKTNFEAVPNNVLQGPWGRNKE